MRKKIYMILIISVIGFSTGFYLKYIKAYTDDKLQIETTNLKGEKIQRQPNLKENIAMLEKLENIAVSNNVEFKENKPALKRPKTINIIYLTIMILSCLAFLWTFQKIIKTNRS